MTAARPPAGTGLPAGLAPPVKVALARAVTKMPRAGALPGKLIYEPKWDGYRAIGIRDNSGATLWSRQGKDLTRYSVGLQHDHGDFSLVKGQLVVRDRCCPLTSQLIQ